MGDYVSRLADPVLKRMLRDHPAILINGPRAIGKTTTAARAARTVMNLADARRAEAFAADPRSVLAGLPEPILIDEWQLVPESLAAVKDLVDAEPNRGRFIVAGSVRGDIDRPTWPGTGRLVRLNMYGLIERELAVGADSPSWLERVLAGRIDHPRSDLDVRGYLNRALRSGYPEPALQLDGDGRSEWLASYVDQLVVRDAQTVGHGRDPARLRRYLHAVALNTAGIVADNTLFDSAQISKQTGRAYDALLQNLLVTEQVPAWTSNRLKRLVLSPKRYLVDAGLLVGILGISERDALQDGDLLGRVLDTFVTAQIRAELALLTPSPRLHHVRTAQGRHEIDLVIEIGAGQLVAIEIKASSAPKRDDARHLHWLREELGSQVIASILLHTGPYSFELEDGIHACPISALWS